MALIPSLSDLGALTNPYGVPAQGKWNLARGTFVNAKGQSVVFFYEVKDPDPSKRTGLDQTADAGGRRLAVNEIPYKDGQALRDLGRKGFTFTFNIKFWGLNYQEIFKQFFDVAIDQPGTGTLTHPTLSPVFGAFTVRLREWDFVHRHDEYNAITIKCVFLEDTTKTLQTLDQQVVSADTKIRTGLQSLVNSQAAVSLAISAASGLLLLPTNIQAALNARLTSLTGQISRLYGQLGATFSSDSQLQTLAQASLAVGGGVAALSSGTVTNGTTTQSLPPVFQVGFDPTTDASIQANLSDFVDANQITPEQAVFSANQARAGIATAIAEIESRLGNYGADAVLEYRQLAVTIQETVEASISSQTKIIVYTLPVAMSVRKVAFANGLDPDRQNDIADLNPYLGSLNYIPAGTQVLVPAA